MTENEVTAAYAEFKAKYHSVTLGEVHVFFNSCDRVRAEGEATKEFCILEHLDLESGTSQDS